MVLEELQKVAPNQTMENQEEAHKELARRRAEVLSSLENWCRALKNIVEAPMGAPIDATPTEKEGGLQSRLRDALFTDICNALAFSGAAGLNKEASTPVRITSQRQVSKSTGLMTPRTSITLTPRTPKTSALRENLRDGRALVTVTRSKVEKLSTPRDRGTPGRHTGRPVDHTTPGHTGARPQSAKLERENTQSTRGFQMPAFAGVRRASSPNGTCGTTSTSSKERPVGLGSRSSSLKIRPIL
ncbi:unnamed protein product [Durusdinium trenchii]|uniref:Uncharacterized protein n=1 Tax=Durusdinium trenchii TaxID=1381693 RepID=A0ABP0R2F4_9DINO